MDQLIVSEARAYAASNIASYLRADNEISTCEEYNSSS